ncbi:FAD-binding oxidoreductase [Sphingosinicella terrae]|uniref:FAD-binding oxidoreductase n=1 Tax=Sphingosinicella terrae TaxID=2172047 RepID=UPI000E0E0595|nr:FAD-binding oxidoreductase [Sphingosinicella terrae]
MSLVGLVHELGSRLGDGAVLTERADLERYQTDGRRTSGRAAAVIRPRCAAEVADTLRSAAAHQVHVIAQGGGTGLVGAGLADSSRTSVILSVERLSESPVIDPLNRTAEAGAGLRLSALNEAAAEHGLYFPIDLGADPSVGGLIAANAGGARFLRHGDVRRNLLGLELVLSDGQGTIVRLGGPLWKNNSEIDLKQLVAGSSGGFGIVTRAFLALSPKPASQLCAMLSLADAGQAPELLVALEHAFGGLLSAFEGISGAALSAALGHFPRLRDPFRGAAVDYAVLVELSAGAAVDEAALEDMFSRSLIPWIERGVVRDAVLDRGRSLWAVRHAIPEALRAEGTVIACDVALRRGELMHFRADVAGRLKAVVPSLRLHDFGHIGDGGLHFNLVWPRTAGPFDPAIADRAREIVFAAAVEDYGGSFSAEHGIGPSNEAFYRRYVAEPVRRLSGHIQRQFAPIPIGRVDFLGNPR